MHKSGASNIKYFALLRTKIGLNLRAEADRYKLGYLWWILEPLLFAAAMYVVFVIYLGLRTDDVVAFLLTGMIPFQWFAKSVSNSMGSIKGAKGLLINFPINPAFFPLVHMGQDAVKQVFTFGFLFFDDFARNP